MQDRIIDAPTTPVAIAWVAPDGVRRPLGEGRIDARGTIAIDAPRPGMAAYLAGEIAPLNAREDVVVKEPWPGEPGALRHRRVPRHAPEFLDELKVYALRALSLELVFDAAAFAPPAPAPLPLAGGDAPSPDAIPPLADDRGGVDLDAYGEADEDDEPEPAPFEPPAPPRFGEA